MERKEENWHPEKMYCPNCRTLLVGMADRKGIVKIVCNCCAASIVKTTMSRRHHRLDVYASKVTV